MRFYDHNFVMKTFAEFVADCFMIIAEKIRMRLEEVCLE